MSALPAIGCRPTGDLQLSRAVKTSQDCSKFFVGLGWWGLFLSWVGGIVRTDVRYRVCLG